MFNFFINNLPNIEFGKTVLFADDAVIYVTDNELEICIRKIKYVINELSVWLNNNKLVPNISKTKLMLFTPRLVCLKPDVLFND